MQKSLLGVLVCVAMFGSDSPRYDDAVTPSLEFTSRSEVRKGLQMAIKSLWRDGDKLHLAYTIRWCGEREFKFEGPGATLSVNFRDADGICRQVEIRLGGPRLSDAFRAGTASVWEGTEVADIPVWAKTVSIGWFDPAIETKCLPIPK